MFFFVFENTLTYDNKRGDTKVNFNHVSILWDNFLKIFLILRGIRKLELN